MPNGIPLVEDFQRFASGRTLVFYDLRNRGRSDAVADVSRLKRGIHNDVDDLEAVRRHFGAERVDLIGHSYVGLTVLLHAMKRPPHVSRVVAIGALPPDSGKEYPPHLTGSDGVLPDVLAQLSALQKERSGVDPTEYCRRAWSVLRRLYVVDPRDAHRIRWDRCDLANERSFMGYWTESLLPSIRSLTLTARELAAVRMPVLLVHGTRDRSSPYGGARDWARLLPDARLLAIEDAAHAPWIEAPDVLGSIETFLDGAWPEAARKVSGDSTPP